jgi:hypothetical protein
MRRSGWVRFDLAPLAHPAWWAALVVLAVNDHVLKGAGILPGWLTGKLSDFAFLIVAPVLAAVALPCAIRHRRALALVAVGGLFAAAKLSRAVSDELVATLRHAGLVWRLWPDPTDLMALVVLPIAGRVLRAPPHRLARLLPQRAGVLLGALACAATSAPIGFSHNAFLLNAAPSDASVTITWLLRRVPCTEQSGDASNGTTWLPADLATTVAASLTPGDLGDPLQVDLQSGQTAALDGQPAPGVSPAGICTAKGYGGSGSDCVAAILDSPPAAPVLMVAPPLWRESEDGGGCGGGGAPPVFRCAPMMDPTKSAGPDAVTLQEVDGTLAFVAGSRVRLAPVDLTALMARTSPPGSCRALRDQYEAMLQPQSCSSDGDCVAVQNLPIPGAPTPCGIDTTLSGAQALASLGTRWDDSCVNTDTVGCSVPQPAVCRAGSCAAACPGETVPTCVGPCYGDYAVEGTPCNGAYGTPCTRAGGYVCDCVNDKVACHAPQPVSATCPLTCLDPPGGGTYIHGLIVHPPLGSTLPTDAGQPGGDASPPHADARSPDARD